MVTPAAIFVGILLAQTPSSYDVRRDAAVTACEAIDRSESQGGLYGNPDGYRLPKLKPASHRPTDGAISHVLEILDALTLGRRSA